MFGKILLASLFALSALPFADAAELNNLESKRENATKQEKQGNYKFAFTLYRELALDSANSPKYAAVDIADAVRMLDELGDIDQVEPFLIEAAAKWRNSWRVLSELARRQIELPPLVELVNGHYVRTSYWRGNNFNASERDRVAALRLMRQAETLLDQSADPATDGDKAAFYARFAEILGQRRVDGAAWRLTALTDLDTLPDPENYDTYYGFGERGAPVDADGNPLFHSVPESWEAARNDGERWRWLLGRMARYGKDAGGLQSDLLFARFLARQFGVQTMGHNLPIPRDTGSGEETGPFAVRTLAENETIARLATGLKRFTLPDEFNYIRILRDVAQTSEKYFRTEASRELAQIFENRQQYPKAVEFWKRITAAGDDKPAKEAIRRITGRNGMLESGPVRPAGSATSLSYLFRNGEAVAMKAQRLDERTLLNDVRRLIKSNRQAAMEMNPAMNRPDQIGRLVVERNAKKYIKETVAEWEVNLSPLPDHMSRRIGIDMPFAGAGCYLVTAKMRDGNVSRVILWIADLALVRKPSFDKQILYVADAVTGAPVAGATVTFFGYSQRHFRNTDILAIDTTEYAETTDADGLVLMNSDRLSDRNWLMIAETKDGRLAYTGFDYIWAESPERREQRQESAFIMTDRPVYRPDQKVNFKAWLGRPVYHDANQPPYIANRNLTVQIRNPRGETIYSKTLTTDEFGGVADEITLDKSAPLGAYYIGVDNVSGNARFHLEEYKKPEFEVTVETPEQALLLGDTAHIKVNAKYYFGSPVAKGKVSYKVTRTPSDRSWYPPWQWDWLYGSGSWWQSYDYAWLPGWSNWGVARPAPAWMPPRYVGPPELVAEGEGELDADGVFRLPIDTMPAKELYGDQDHQYRISVEVADQSRRVITGSGQVVASRKPFTATVWADRGYYLVGQRMNISLRAARPMGAPVQASGKATLYRITYDAAGDSREEEVLSRDIATDSGGNAALALQADRPGQYRLSCILDDGSGARIEGAAVVTIRGAANEGDFRFAAIELVPDRRDYQPGDKLKLAVNSERKDATVLLFPRVERRGDRPIVVKLENGGKIVELDVMPEDQPNFFCTVVTVFDGAVHSETREVFVPPAQKTLNVEIKPNADSYAPGAKAEFAVTVTDADGKPVRGECVVTVYDRSVEYISGGSNVGDIRSHFWKWKRGYYPNLVSSLNRYGYRAEKKGDVNWEPIGIFGGQEADWNDDAVYTNGKLLAGSGGGARMQRPRMMKAEVAMEMPAMAAAPMAAPMQADAEMSVAQDSAMEYKADAGGGDMVEPEVRREFADTALWLAALRSDSLGRASFSLDMPENLTAWKARVWTMASHTRVGEAEATVETRKNIMVRPQLPRFLTQKDQVVLSANLHNYLPRAKTARVELVLEGGLLEAAESVPLTRTVKLASNGEERVDWLVNARRPGDARVIMKILTDEESDAAEVSIPVIVHGARRVESFGGVIRGDEKESVVKIRVPKDRLAERSRLELTFSPSIATAMLDALPYLIEYPYGCTEQTLNRFLPVVMTRSYLDNLGLSLGDAQGVIANQRTDAQSAEWLKKFGDTRRDKGRAVFDDAELAAMVKAGIERLAAMQVSDGGWGWFSGWGEQSWPHTTAVVAHGLAAAKANGAAIPSGMLQRGIDWLRGYQNAQLERLQNYVSANPEKAKNGKQRPDNLDAFIYMILVDQGHFNPAMRERLHESRLDLSLSGLAMLGIALQKEGATEKLPIVLQNLEQFLERDAENGTAWLKVPRNGWWWWYNDDIETQAWYLTLLSRTEPTGDIASGVAKYLLRNRKNGTYWRSTRDTAYAVEALTHYAKASGETAPDMTVAVYYDGAKVMERTLKAENILDDNRFILEGLAVEEGEHEIRIVRSGAGNVYFGGSLDLFSLEDPIAKAGMEVKIDRAFHKLTREDKAALVPDSSGHAGAVAVEKYRRTRLPSPFDKGGAAKVEVKSGDLIEVELTIETKNDYEYLVFEDMKAAGLEAVELRSGYGGNNMGAYVEYRDEKVVLFVRYLPQGVHTIAYRFRAEIPGSFSALPTFGGGMYATDLFANSDEMKITVVDN